MYYSRVEYSKRYGVQSILLLSAAAGGAVTFCSVSLRIFWGKYGRDRSPLAVGAGGRRIQAERQLVCHMEKDGPEERGAFTLVHPCRERQPRGEGGSQATPNDI